MKLRAIEKTKKYIPVFNKNRDAKPEDQVVVNISRFPGVGEKKAYKVYIHSYTASTYSTTFKDLALMSNHIKSITNLNDGVNDILTGEDVYNSTHDLCGELLTELRQYLMESVEELTEKEK